MTVDQLALIAKLRAEKAARYGVKRIGYLPLRLWQPEEVLEPGVLACRWGYNLHGSVEQNGTYRKV